MARPFPPISRRRAMQLGAAATGALGLPTRARASSASDRRFIFVFAKGGWDITWALAQTFDTASVDTPSGAEPATGGGIPFVAHARTPGVEEFFTKHGDKACVIQGMEVRSVAHNLCTRLVLTNGTGGLADDWGAIIAGNAATASPLPLLHLSGPSFCNSYSDSVVRVGSRGQLAELLDGSATEYADTPVYALPSDVEAMLAARARERADAFANAHSSGRHTDIAAAAAAAESQLEELASAAEALSASAGATDLVSRLALPVDALEAGLCKVAMLSYESWEGVFNGWDSHTDNTIQAPHWNELMAGLTWLIDELAARNGPAGGTLLDETTVVVLSEMSRFPLVNGDGGKDHWTYTSAMLIGAGVAGGRIIGGYDAHLIGRPINLRDGSVDDAGEALLPGHLGATILALGDVDPGPWVEGADPISAALA